MSHLAFCAIWRYTTCWSCIPGPFCECKQSSGASVRDERQGGQPAVDASARGADSRGTETAAECEKDPGALALASPLAGLK